MKKIFFIVLVNIFFLSCNEVVDIPFRSELQDEFSVGSMVYKDNEVLSKRYISDEQIEQIGRLHNLGLQEAFASFNWNAVNLKRELTNSFTNVSYVRSNKIVFDNTVRTNNDNLIRIKGRLVNVNNFAYFRKVLDFLYDDEDKDFEMINTFLVTLANEMKRNSIEVRDYETFLVFATVMRYSSKFWLDSEIGGLNNYEKLKKQSGSSYERGWKKCLKDVLVADGTSAGASFIIAAGAAALTGPVAPFVFIAEIAAGSGFSSGVAYFQSSNC